MIELRTPTELDGLRAAGRFVADVLDELLDTVDVGVNLLELDRVAARMIADRGAESCYVDYHPSFGKSPFGKNLCTSVNDAALHGLPFDHVLQDGDLVSLDFAASVDGWVADSAVSVQVGTPATRTRRSSTPSSAPWPLASRRLRPATSSATCRTRSGTWRSRRATASTCSSAGTESVARCTGTRTCRTTDVPVAV